MKWSPSILFSGAHTWNRASRNLPLLLFIIVFLWLGLWVTDIPSVHAMVKRWTGEREEQAATQAQTYDATHVRWSRAAPGILFIDFDPDSVTAAEQASRGVSEPTSLKRALVTVLDWLHADVKARPALVFLDISPIGEPSNADAALKGALQRWSGDPKSAPLAIFAGSVCRSSNPEIANTPLAPSAFSPEVLPLDDGSYPVLESRSGLRRAIWSCPTYDGLNERDFWSCIEANDSGKQAALPSPAWFAIAVRHRGRDFLDALRYGLSAAGDACLGALSRLRLDRTEIAKSNPVTLTFDVAHPYASQLNGNPIVLPLVAHELLAAIASRQANASDYDGKIVVIGSTAEFRRQNDEIETSLGHMPGSVMVAAELRSAWATGYPRGKSWWATQIVATLLVVISFLILQFASGLKRRRGRGHSAGARAIVVATNLHVLAIFVIPFLSLAAFFVGQWLAELDGFKVAFAFIVTEVLFVATSIVQELRHEHHMVEDHRLADAADGRRSDQGGAAPEPASDG